MKAVTVSTTIPATVRVRVLKLAKRLQWTPAQVMRECIQEHLLKLEKWK